MEINNESRAKLIIWLRDRISEEIEKPENEIDYELVDSCSKLLAELIGDTEKLSKEELEERYSEIINHKPMQATPGQKMTFRMKGVLSVVCAAMVIVGGSFAVSAFKPSTMNYVLSALNLNKGGEFEEAGITYRYMGEAVVYSSVSEIIEKEDIGIILPTELPEGIRIESIIRNDEKIVIEFNDDVLNVAVYFDCKSEFDELKNNSEKYVCNDIISNIAERDGIYISYTFIDSNVYIVKSDNIDEIKLILTNLKGGN